MEKEKWKSSALEFGLILNRIQNLPSLVEAFQLKKVETNGVEKVDEDKNGDEKNGVEKNGDEEALCNGVLNNNIKEDIQSIIDKNPGSIIVSIIYCTFFFLNDLFLYLAIDTVFHPSGIIQNGRGKKFLQNHMFKDVLIT